MNEPRFTSGPYSMSGIRISGSSFAKERLLTVTASDVAIAFVVYSDLKPGDHVQSHADQRLFAAAWDMYRALMAALPVIETAHQEATLSPNTPSDWWQYHEELEIVKAALAKATGEQPSR